MYSNSSSIASLVRWHGAPITLAELTDDTVAAWLTALLDASVARATIKSYRGNILTLWRFAWSRGDVAHPPRFVKLVKLPKRIPSAWTLEQLGAILDSARREPGDIGRRPAAHFWEALILTLYDTGGRITSVMQARTSDVDLQAKTIILRAEYQKTGRDEVFTLSDQTVAALKRIWSHGRELAFGDWPFDWTQHDWGALANHYRKILHRAKLPGGRRDLFHKLRRTTATQLAIALGNKLEVAAHLAGDQ